MRTPAGIATRRAAALALAALLVLAAATPAAVGQTPAPVRESEALDPARAYVEMERLHAEIVTLRSLAGAQAALLAWNRERAGSGGGPAVLPSGLCAEPALRLWCWALPATFGVDVRANGQGEDGER